ncbi:MAG: hypothetical protein JXB23_12965 [Candidatus Aminicenantes bacterium]|nr:hypothetical protein [Candidatus Aminicenantes bacterium]
MGLKRKQVLMRQKAYFEQKLQDRLSFLSGKGVKSPEADKDTLVRNLQANIRAVKSRLRLIADNEKRTEEMAKAKSRRAAALQKEQEEGQSEKPTKAPEEGKGKKTKADRKAYPPKATESSVEGKAAMKKKEEETREEPVGRVKADKS